MAVDPQTLATVAGPNAKPSDQDVVLLIPPLKFTCGSAVIEVARFAGVITACPLLVMVAAERLVVLMLEAVRVPVVEMLGAMRVPPVLRLPEMLVLPFLRTVRALLRAVVELPLPTSKRGSVATHVVAEPRPVLKRPRAVTPIAAALVLMPAAVELSPDAVVAWPKAVEFAPVAFVVCPRAVEMEPDAVVLKPRAAE